MANTRDITENLQESAKANSKPINPLDNLTAVASHIAKLIEECDIAVLNRIISQALTMYESNSTILSRLFREGREDEIKQNISAASQPQANIVDKPTINLYKKIVTKEGGNKSNSFNTYFISFLIKELTIFDADFQLSEVEIKRLKKLILRSMTKRRERALEINEQEILLREAEEARLKKEREVLEVQLKLADYKIKCEELANQRDSQMILIRAYKNKLLELKEEKKLRKKELKETTLITDEERAKLAQVTADFNHMNELFKAVHSDYAFEGLTKPQLIEVRTTGEQAAMLKVWDIKREVEKQKEIVSVKALKTTAKNQVPSETACVEEEAKLRKARKEELDVLAKERLKVQSATQQEVFKNKLAIMYRLKFNAEKQKEIQALKIEQTSKKEELDRELSLEKNGYYVNNKSLNLTDAIISAEAPALPEPEKKPRRKFADMTVACGFKSSNLSYHKAIQHLSAFKAKKILLEEKTHNETLNNHL